MRKLVVALGAVLVSTAAHGYEVRCQTNYYWNQAYSRCVPWYTEREIYEMNQRAAERTLEYSSRGGTRRASDRACKAAIEAGVENDLAWSYGCRE